MLLDDQVVKTQAMRASPFIKPLEAAALSWEKLLLAAQVRLATPKTYSPQRWELAVIWGGHLARCMSLVPKDRAEQQSSTAKVVVTPSHKPSVC
jgi:hypothetical protein